MSNRKSHFVRRFQTLPSALAAVLALLALTLQPTAAQAQTAQAQTELWSATMTVGSQTASGLTFLGWSDSGTLTGSVLTDEDFDYGDHTYNLAQIDLVGGSLSLFFNNTGAGDLATKATRDKLTLHVGGTTFNLGNGNLSNQSMGVTWNNSGLTWAAGDTVALQITTTDPGAPGLTATPGPARVTLSWTPPTTSGGSAITGYEYRQRTGDDYAADAWTEIPNSASLTSYDVTSLTPGTAYTFQLRARNSGGAGLYSDEATATPAQAQTSGQVWTATLDPLETPIGHGCYVSGATSATCPSLLSEDSFSYDGTDYRVAGVVLFKQSSALPGTLDVTIRPPLSEVAISDLRLNVGCSSFELSDAEVEVFNDGGSYKFAATRLSWAAGTDVALSLTKVVGSNSAAMGAPTITVATGTPLVGEPLSVDTSEIRDDDGLTNVSFCYRYRWIRIEEDGAEALLGHAKGDTYRPTVHDLGSRLKVLVSFIDDLGHDEMRTSEATDSIAAPMKLAGDFDLPSSVANPRGIWGNDETIWVANPSKTNFGIFAYSRATQQRDTDKDFTATHLDAENDSFFGIWSDGTTMFVVDTGSLRDNRAPKIYAYSLDDKSRDEGKDITLESGNSKPRGMWGNASTLWVANSGNQEGEVDKVFAYRLTDDPATPENEYGAHDPDQDFDTLEPDGRATPTGIWSDGTTMWVVDRLDRKAYAYAMSDRSRLSDQDITLDADNEFAEGAWGDIDAGEVGTLWVVDNQDRKLYAYPIRHTTPSLRSPDAKPTIIGTPMVGQTLTADTDRIGDLNGLPDDVEFRCKWQRVVDGRDIYISGAPQCTYTLPWRYVGLPIRVVVTFKDAGGAFEIRRSDATDPVARGPISNDFDLTRGGAVPLDGLSGIWGDEETIWVSNDGIFTPTRLYAYNRSDGSRAPGKDIRLHVGPDPHINWAQYNEEPRGIWSDGETMFVVDIRDSKVYAYDLATGDYDSDKDITLASDNNGATDIWGNDETIWVANVANRYSLYEKIFAYRRTDGARDPDKDFNTLYAVSNQIPRGICTDGTTMWVLDSGWRDVSDTNIPDLKSSTSLFAYKVSDKTRDESREVNLPTNLVLRGAWCQIGTGDRGTLWVVDRGTKKLHTYGITVEPPATDPAAEEAQAELPETAPSAVRGLGYSVGDGGITLSWQAPEEDGGGEPVFYRVERSTDGSNYEELETGTLETSWLDAAPPAGGGVYYRVTAYNAVGEGPWSGVALILAEEPANAPATGAPTIDGTARVGETLTADTLGIDDDEGLNNVLFSYQWVRRDGGADTDIQDATGSSYTLTEEDEGKTIKVRVSFTDDAGHEESLTSDPTGAVTPEAGPLAGFSLVAGGTGDELLALVEGVQVVTGEYNTSSFAIRANLEAGETVGGVKFHLVRDGVNVTADGGKTESYAPYSLYGDGGEQNLTGAALPEGDYRLTATAHSEKGAGGDKLGRLEVSFTVVETAPTPADTPAQEPPPNTLATGAPTISGTEQVGETLTADTSGITDDDGLTNVAFSYQWIRGSTDIAGATGSSYTLVEADEGMTIKVKVSFTDAEGSPETLTSDPTGEVEAKPNSSATGVPTISGPARVGETLTADTSGITDDDGLTNVAFSYQWLAGDAEITGANGSSYTLTEGDEGRTVKVTVSFTDAEGNPEILTSDSTGAVEPKPNSSATGLPTISGAARVGETLTADTSGIDDDDGLTNVAFSYQWLRNDGGSDSNIQDATGSSYTLTGDDEGMTIKVTVSFTDAEGNPETLTSDSTGEVEAKPNTRATGTPAIGGTEQVGETLRADTSGITDDDGLDNATFAYQWLRGEAEIAGATGSSYTLTEDDEGKTIKVTVSFTDDQGHAESLTSDPTGAVAAAETVPGRPQDLDGKASAQGIALTWSAPSGSTVTQYVVYRGELENGSMNGRPMTEYATIDAAGEAMQYTDDKAEAGVEYRYRVAAVNSAGEGKKSTWLDIEAGDSE